MNSRKVTMSTSEVNGEDELDTSFRSSNGETTRMPEDGEHFTNSETKLVNRSKFLVYLAIFLAAIAVSVSTYFLLSKDEENTMVVEFHAYSREILKQATANSENMFEEIWDMSKAITSHALFANMTWPNVTLPHFGIRAQDERTRIEFVGFAPFVTPENRDGWEEYSVANQGWIAEAYKYRGWNETPGTIPPNIHKPDFEGKDTWFTDRRFLQDDVDPSMFEYEIPLWQVAPAPTDMSIINMDLASHPVFAHLLWDVKVKKVDQYSRAIDVAFLLGEDTVSDGHPRGTIYQPVFDDFHKDAEVVGFTVGILMWDSMFENVLFDSVEPILVEIEGNCSTGFSYLLTENEVIYLGAGSGNYDPKYDKYRLSADLLEPKNSREGYPPVQHTHRPTDAAHNESHCTYVMNTYPTEEFADHYNTDKPVYYTLAIASVFIFTALVFLVYDWLVQQRQNKLLSTAMKTDAIVSSLFPKDVQKRIMQETGENAAQDKKNMGGKGNHMSNYMDIESEKNNIRGMPIADLFPAATIMFADIVGFTAWSSMREPTQVFRLLETIYNSFDVIAKRRKVFKVETVGDCYVAVSGLPDPRKDHAVAMAKFARDCLATLPEQLRALETELGPDTSDLGVRIGLNSGPVTAGVLRGERARFQLFGDTVNTTARIETTGAKNRIHLSEETASILINLGLESWVQKRKDAVQAKGKGELRTFWLNTGSRSGGDPTMTFSSHVDYKTANDLKVINEKNARLVNWISEILGKYVKQIVTKRAALKGNQVPDPEEIKAVEHTGRTDEGNVLNEMEDIIDLPTSLKPGSRYSTPKDADLEELSPAVAGELREYVNTVATMYSDNAFHNFAHASHVTMSVVKLLSRIVGNETTNEATKYDHTYGITSDPLTQFSLVFSAFIHDVYHPGVPNCQLVKEKDKVAALYNDKSVAEQKSVDFSWKLLMEPPFSNLRSAIYSNEKEYKRFRQLVVNSVMATDIMDKELNAARKARWEKAFSEQASSDGDEMSVSINRKATIVIEHLIQASDVAHTMQHWHIYRKFNARLFEEMYTAYINGRSATNPADTWYEGEIGFFDFYIIPLAKKLGECGVFGVTSDEYLNYALKNRKEWESKGREVVAEMLETMKPRSSNTQESAPSKVVSRELWA